MFSPMIYLISTFYYCITYIITGILVQAAGTKYIDLILNNSYPSQISDAERFKIRINSLLYNENTFWLLDSHLLVVSSYDGEKGASFSPLLIQAWNPS